MDTADAVRIRRCTRTFTILAEGGVRIDWACGAHKVDRTEDAVDVEYLADHLPTHHHHRHHLPQHLPHLPHHQGAIA